MLDGAIKYIAIEVGRIAWRENGAGRPLLLTQRYRAPMDDWDPELIAKLASQRRVIRFDGAGIGRSEGQAPESVGGMADVAVAFLDAIGEQQVDILGWSLGGFVAQQLALDHPERVRRLIIAGSGCGGVPEAPNQEDLRPPKYANAHIAGIDEPDEHPETPRTSGPHEIPERPVAPPLAARESCP